MLRELMTLQDRMNRLFEQTFPRIRPFKEEGLFPALWTPAVDIYETDSAVVLKADLPDVDPKDVEVQLEDNILYLKGERKMEKEIKEENCYRMERVYGSFSRSFALPHTVVPEKISAEYKNGVLTVTMPKKEEAKPKQIKVNVV